MKYLVISDIHGNYPALMAVLDAEPDFDRILFLGDVIDYGAQAHLCIEVLKSTNAVCLIGNHELKMLGRLKNVQFNSHAEICNKWSRDHTSSENWAWLDSKKPRMLWDDSALLVHGTPMDPAMGYLADTNAILKSFEEAKSKFIFCGHTHVPVMSYLEGETMKVGFGPQLANQKFHHEGSEGRFIINVGSVGQPRDGDARASYVVWDDKEIVFGRIGYDIEAAQQAILDEGLPEFNAQRLVTGQ